MILQDKCECRMQNTECRMQKREKRKTLVCHCRMALGFSWGHTTLSFPFIAYILISICLGMYLIKYMYTQGKQISGMIVLVLLILVFIFFGKRWFQYGQLKGTSAWITANALAQSGQSSTPSGKCSDGSSAVSTFSAVWPPVVNHCPDFMTLDSSNNCLDSNKLYGTGTLGTTTVLYSVPIALSGAKAICTTLSPSNDKDTYLRWEGVVETEGTCVAENIGKKPSN